MGSLGRHEERARTPSDRYVQQDVEDVGKLVPEGIEGRVPTRARWRRWSTSSSAACAPAWATVGAADIADLQDAHAASCASPAPACARATRTTS